MESVKNPQKDGDQTSSNFRNGKSQVFTQVLGIIYR